MESLTKKNDFFWKHPVPVSLLKQHGYEEDLSEIIERASESLLCSLRKEFPDIFSKGSISIPVESIASALNIDFVWHKGRSSFDASLKRSGTKLEVSQSSASLNYFRSRFSIAHEIGHLFLRRLAGPLSLAEIAQTKDTNDEEEMLCDLFASSLLMPKYLIETYLKRSDGITPILVNEIGRDFKVSKGVVLRRIAEITNSILLLWDEIKNPLNKNSNKEQRIKQVYKPVSELHKYYIPLYCTASDLRFDPNIILDAIVQCSSISGKVEIKNLGTLPNRTYLTHNLFFQRWADSLINSGLVETRQRFFNMATFVNIGK